MNQQTTPWVTCTNSHFVQQQTSYGTACHNRYLIRFLASHGKKSYSIWNLCFTVILYHKQPPPSFLTTLFTLLFSWTQARKLLLISWTMNRQCEKDNVLCFESRLFWYTVIIIAKAVTNDLLCNHECATCTEQIRGNLFEHRWTENKDHKNKYIKENSIKLRSGTIILLYPNSYSSQQPILKYEYIFKSY